MYLLENYIHALYLQLSFHKPQDIDVYLIAQHFNVQLYLWDESSQALTTAVEKYIFLNHALPPTTLSRSVFP